MSLETILNMAAQAEAMRPAVKQLKEAILAYGEDAADIMEPFVDYAADISARVYKRLRDEHGLSEAAALQLTSVIANNIKNGINSQSSKG